MVDGERRPEPSGGTGEDAHLIARMAAGDAGAAVEELVRRYGGRLYGVGLQLLGDRGLAEELVQETFVRLWRRAPMFEPGRGTASAFIFAIARRVAVDLWRRPSSRPLGTHSAGTRPVIDADHATGVVDAVTLGRALESLSPGHRRVLELAFGADLTQAEIARRTGLPLGTVKTRRYYALRALKVALEAEGVDA